MARGAGVARSTVQDPLRRIATSGMKPDELQGLDDAALDERLFGPPGRRDTSRPLPDWSEIERQLRGRAVTLRLLWKEYEDANGKEYKYSQFVAHFRAWQRVSRPPVMHQVHRAGEEMEVDYAGMTLTVYDQGVARDAQIFVACLPCSQLTFAEASWSQSTEDWLGAHVRALTFFGGCPEKLVPDFVPGNKIRLMCPPALCGGSLLCL